MRTRNKFLTIGILVLLVVVTPLESGVLLYQQPVRRTSDYSGQGMPFTPDELQQLVAPIALYPDSLLAQAITAATYPDQIVAAADFLAHEKTTGNSLMKLVSSQPWDPSVKALTEFPPVLNNMAQNLTWTSQLGEVYRNQLSEVMAAIQALRAKALAAGNLKGTPQLRVNQPTPDIISLQPANPQVVYIPLYNPALVYGTPMQTPNYSLAGAPATSAISMGLGVAAGALTAGGCCDWGSTNWDCNWYHGVAYYHDYPYYGNNAWQGNYYGGYNRYGHHTYHTLYDYTHPYTAFQNGKSSRAIAPAAGTEITSTGKIMTVENRDAEASDAFNAASGGWRNTEELRGWGASDTGASPTVFSSWGHRPGSSAFGNAGWGGRSASFRGWTIQGGNGGGWGNGGSRSR